MLPLPPLPTDVPSLLLGFSGGLDSSVLLHRLLHTPFAHQGRLRAIHVHHGLQAQADDWAAHCQQLCATWGIALTIARVQVDTQRGEGLEAAARQARQAAFAAAMMPGEALVTAHHQDDQAETFLLRALRASGVDGLAAMRPWRRFDPGWQWRPLLDTSRAALHAYAHRHGLNWIEDPSNHSLAQDRNFLRQQILPLLQQRWPHAQAALARSAALARDSSQLLEHEDALALAQASTLDPHTLRVSALRTLPATRRARVLRRWLAQLHLPPLPAQGVQQLEHDLLPEHTQQQPQFDWHNARIWRWRDLLHADHQRPTLPLDWQGHWHSHAPLCLPTGDCLHLIGAVWPTPLRITARHGGERLHQPGRKHSQSLKKLLQAQGIAPWERQALPLLYDADGQLLAAGDLLLSARMEEWLCQHNALLHWERAA